jgi:heme exporter protein D
MVAMGNLGGARGTNIYLSREAPHYWTGYGVSLGVVVLSLVATVFTRWKLKKINAQRDEMSSEDIFEKHTEEELEEMVLPAPCSDILRNCQHRVTGRTGHRSTQQRLRAGRRGMRV